MEDQVFGETLNNLNYKKRKGVYAVIFNSEKNKIVTVQTARGHYFLPGGGIEANEKNEDCLKREMLEETGYEISIGSFIGKAMKYFLSTKNEPILSEGYFYLAELLNKTQNPVENDRFLKWISVKILKNSLYTSTIFGLLKRGLRIWTNQLLLRNIHQIGHYNLKRNKGF